jgi:hypothetical protein
VKFSAQAMVETRLRNAGDRFVLFGAACSQGSTSGSNESHAAHGAVANVPLVRFYQAGVGVSSETDLPAGITSSTSVPG